MSTAQARIGIIGAGWWAAANHLPVLAACPDAEVVAVNRLGAGALAEVQRAFGIPYANEDYRRLLDDNVLDGVVISSPHPLHYGHARAALERGLHVLIEKPMTTKAEDARALVRLAREKDRQILIAYGWNYSPFARRAAALVAQGALGEIRHVALHMASALEDLFAGRPMEETAGAMFQPPPSTWADPARAGGYAWGQLTHALGLMFRITDLAPQSVFALTGLSPAGVDYYDAGAVRFANGGTGALSGSATVPKHCGFQIDLRVFGAEGMLLLDIERERLEVRRHDKNDTVVDMKPGDGAYSCDAPLHRLIEYCLGREVANDASGLVGQRAVEVLDAFHRSARSGRMEKV